MKKVFSITAVTLMVIGLLFGAAVALIRLDIFPHDQFDRQLRAAIDKNRGGIIQISDLTPFLWDRMYIYPPYSQAEGAYGEKLDADEGSCILLFKRKGKTIYCLVFKRRLGDFSGEYRKDGYDPKDAFFSVQNGNHKYWPSIKCLNK